MIGAKYESNSNYILKDNVLFLQKPGDKNYKLVKNSNVDLILQLVMDKRNIELIYHPVNNITAKFDMVSNDEIDFRTSSVYDRYVDEYSISGHTSFTHIDAIFQLLLSYNWKMFKSFLPIYKVVAKKDLVTGDEFKLYLGVKPESEIIGKY